MKNKFTKGQVVFTVDAPNTELIINGVIDESDETKYCTWRKGLESVIYSEDELFGEDERSELAIAHSLECSRQLSGSVRYNEINELENKLIRLEKEINELNNHRSITCTNLSEHSRARNAMVMNSLSTDNKVTWLTILAIFNIGLTIVLIYLMFI